jgi:hypothetical protein
MTKRNKKGIRLPDIGMAFRVRRLKQGLFCVPQIR